MNRPKATSANSRIASGRYIAEAANAVKPASPACAPTYCSAKAPAAACAARVNITSGFSPDLEAVHAHVALADLALDRVELRRVVRAHPGAVAAAEAGLGVLQHRAVFGVLGVGARRAALEAHRVIAMVAGHRDVHALVVGEAAALDITHRAEGQVRRVVVLLAAGRFAGVAADAVVGREEEAVLLVAVGVAADRG